MSYNTVNQNLRENPQYYAALEEEQQFFATLLPSGVLKWENDPENGFLQLTILDFKKECVDNVLSKMEIKKTKEVFEASISGILVAKKMSTAQDREKFLTSENHAELLEEINTQANHAVKCAIQQFRQGALFSVVYTPDHSSMNMNKILEVFQKCLQKPITQSLTSEDLGKLKEINDRHRLVALLKQPPISPREEKRSDMRRKLTNENLAKAAEVAWKENIKKGKELNDCQNYIFFISSKYNINLNQMTDEMLSSEINQKAYDKFKEKKQTDLEELETKRAHEIEQSFLAAPVVKAAKPKGKNRGKKGKKPSFSTQQAVVIKVQESTTSVTAEKRTAIVLPSIFSQKECFLDKRITRWFGAKPEAIKQFTDKVMQKIVHSYQGCTRAELEEQRIYHSLVGVERLMSLSLPNLQRYSVPYQFMHNGSLKNGRCFMAELIHGDTKESGMIYVGIDSKRIYHAKFVPSGKKESTSTGIKPIDFCLTLDGLDSLPNPDQEEVWEMQGGYSFEMKDSKIIWSIADKQSPIQYQILPLS